MQDDRASSRVLIIGACLAIASAGMGFVIGKSTAGAPAASTAPAETRTTDVAPPNLPKNFRAKSAKQANFEQAEKELAELGRRAQLSTNAHERFQFKSKRIDILSQRQRLPEALAEADQLRKDNRLSPGQWKYALSKQIGILQRMRNIDDTLNELMATGHDRLSDRDLYMLADLQGLAKRPEAQIDTLKLLRKRTPSDSGIQHKLVSVLMRANRLDDSGSVLEELRAQNDTMFPHRAYDLARYCRKSGKVEIISKLAAQVDEFAASGMNPPQSWSIASRIYALAGDVDSANRALDKWAQGTGRPRDVERAKVRRVEVLMDAGLKPDAARLLPETEKVLHFKENVAYARNLRRRLGLPVEVERGPRPK